MSEEALISTLFVLAPGFVTIKLVQMFATQWRRSDWEWTIWSVVAGLALAVVVGVIPWRLVGSGTIVLTPNLTLSTDGIPERFIGSVLLGLLLALAWRLALRSGAPWLKAGTRQLRNSAWDTVLDEVAALRGGVEITLNNASVTERYYGALHSYGREANQAAPWVYLWKVQEFNPATRAFEPLPRTSGLMFHADRISRLRVVLPNPSPAAVAGDRMPDSRLTADADTKAPKG